MACCVQTTSSRNDDSVAYCRVRFVVMACRARKDLVLQRRRLRSERSRVLRRLEASASLDARWTSSLRTKIPLTLRGWSRIEARSMSSDGASCEGRLSEPHRHHPQPESRGSFLL